MSDARQGDTATVNAIFTKAGVAVDASEVRVTILNPAGAGVFSTDAVIHADVGTYSYDWPVPADAPTGLWTAQWQGLLPGFSVPSYGDDSFEVFAAYSEGDYGATLAGVQKYLPLFVFSGDSQPSISQVNGFIEDMAARVSARLGAIGLLDPTLASRLRVSARGLVEIGAAAMAEDAGHPEQAGPGSTGWGRTLWERFQSGLDLLSAQIPEGLADAGGDIETSGGVGSIIAGAPLFRSYERY